MARSPSLDLILNNLQIPIEDDSKAAYIVAAAEKLGAVANRSSVKNIVTVVDKTLLDYSPDHIEILREGMVTNFGTSAAAIVDYLEDQQSSFVEQQQTGGDK